VKARRWLGDHEVEVQLRPIVEKPPTITELRDLWKRSGLPLKKFFNTSGQSYRALPEREELESLSDDAKLGLLAKDGKLIKRPILDDGKSVLVGFDPDAYGAWRKAR
jgi:arsenate reductase